MVSYVLGPSNFIYEHSIILVSLTTIIIFIEMYITIVEVYNHSKTDPRKRLKIQESILSNTICCYKKAHHFDGIV